MSKIKEYYLNNLSDEDINDIVNSKMLYEEEYKHFFIQKIKNDILKLKMENEDNKLKIQKLQQELDKLTND